MLKEILNSAKSTLTDRLSSPLLGSFLVSWCLWNWKFLVILFSDAGVTQTFAMVESISFPDVNSIWRNGLAYPLSTSLIYVFLYPFPARFIYGFMLHQNRKTNQMRQSISKETLLTLEESHQLTTEFIELNQKQLETIEKLNEKVTRLTIGTKGKNPNDLPISKLVNLSQNKLSESQIYLLNLISEEAGVANENRIKKVLSTNILQTDFDIEELVRKNFLERITSIRGEGSKLRLTHEGIGFLLQIKTTNDESPKLTTQQS